MTTKTPPEELLAAYASGGDALDATERDAVERLLAERPDARRELDELSAAIRDARDSAPRPEREPAWDDMARAIRAAVDREAARRGPLARLAGWLRVRPVAAGLGAAALAAALLLALRATQSSTAPEVARPQPDTPPPRQLAAELDLPDLDEAWEGDSIVYDLEPTETVDGLSDLFASGDDDEQGADTEYVDFGVAPVFDGFLDELSDEQLERIDEHFEARKAS